jgi:hypothetical protein
MNKTGCFLLAHVAFYTYMIAQSQGQKLATAGEHRLIIAWMRQWVDSMPSFQRDPLFAEWERLRQAIHG